MIATALTEADWGTIGAFMFVAIFLWAAISVYQNAPRCSACSYVATDGEWFCPRCGTQLRKPDRR